MENLNFYYLLSLVDDRHKLKVFNLNSIAMDSVQVGKAVLVKVKAWALSYEQTSAYRLMMYRDSLDGNVTQITKISQIT